MARSKQALGTFGNIAVTGLVIDAETGKERAARAGEKPTTWKARARYRDHDGRSRQVEKRAATRAAAQASLKAALADRQEATGSGLLRSSSTVSQALAVWLEQTERSDLAESTKRQYRDDARRYVEGSLVASLELRELNVQNVERWLQHLADNHGGQAAKAGRKVLSNVLGMSVRYGAVPYAITREVKVPRPKEAKDTVRDTRRAMTREQRDLAIAKADELDADGLQDYADLVAFLAGTGCRISEALENVSWPDFDADNGTIRVRGTKAASADRVLSLPDWLLERLQQRRTAMEAQGRSTEGLVFTSPRVSSTGPRDRRNATRFLRRVLDEAGMPWATSHTFRRTVATLIGESGLSVRAAADQLGHANPAMTASVYLGRKGDLSNVAKVL